MLYEYGIIFILLILALVIALLLFLVSYLLIIKQYDNEKLSAYECGFDPFEDARSRFDVRFYLVSILFIIFDLEVTFLFPWAIVILDIDIFGYFTMIVFLVLLTVGFIYEWIKGALEWE